MSDLISRDAAIAAIENSEFGYTWEVEQAENAVRELPIIETKKGEWIELERFYSKGQVDELQSAKCSVCGKFHTTPFMYYFDKFRYCPNCGAEMKQ